MDKKCAITIIGGGLAGCEAAWQAVKRGAHVRLFEMKPKRFSPAHTLSTLSELVCSNSLKSEGLENASGLLKAEMGMLGSLVLNAAHATKVPAGKTLAVDREAFSAYITDALAGMGVEIIREEVTQIPEDRPLIIATGPLTSDAFAEAVQRLIGSGRLYFYDAVAPIVYGETINMEKAFMASRYNKGGGDYVNCPMDREEYERFVEELLKADMVTAREFEEMRCFEACMPVEEMARRGPKTLMFGPMRPVGLYDPSTGKRPYAAVQLRRENLEGTLYNMVGFQTRLTFHEQKRVFSLIPGLEGAGFARYGKLHRNSYIDSPRLLLNTQQMKSAPSIYFAGQMTGVEGYCESALSGILAGINAFNSLSGRGQVCPPATSLSGSLLSYISDASRTSFQPMNANMGLLPPAGTKKNRRETQVKRALDDFRQWVNESLENQAGI